MASLVKIIKINLWLDHLYTNLWYMANKNPEFQYMG